jgi:OmpA-OmpF porin, OOP family
MTMRVVRFAAVPLLCVAVDAGAVEAPLYEVPYIGGSLSGFNADKARHSDPGSGYEVFGGWPVFSDHEAIELRVLDHQMRRKFGASENNYTTGLFADYIYDFGSIVPGSGFFGGTKLFAGGGLGIAQEDNYGEKVTAPGVDINAGVLVPLGFKGWAIRFDGRVQYEYNRHTCNAANTTKGFCTKETSGLVDTFFAAGLQIPLTIFFDKPVVPETQEDCPVAVVDPVTGRRDCGGKGGDGDGDGALDTSDKCPSTATGFSVNREGCLTRQNVDLPASLFDGKAAAPNAEGKKRLDDIATMLVGELKVVLSVRSMSGGAGSVAFNEMLAQKRVDAVRAHLTAKGVPAEQMPEDNNVPGGKTEITLTITP